MPTKKAWMSTAERRRVAERAERRPQHADLERPEGDRAEQRRVARAQVARSRRAARPSVAAGTRGEPLGQPAERRPVRRAQPSSRRWRSVGTSSDQAR